ncbi:hypothetical protein Leryth_011347, partial [Lithospermum erythrorhizon]
MSELYVSLSAIFLEVQMQWTLISDAKRAGLEGTPKQ